MLTIRAPGYATHELRATAPSHQDVRLYPAAVLAGTVYGAEGAAAEGVLVSIEVEAEGAGPSPTTTTDRYGRYRFTDLLPGSYRPQAETRGQKGQAERWQVLTSGETVETVDIKMRAGKTIAGKVVWGPTSAGPPCDGGGSVRVTGDKLVETSAILADGSFTLVVPRQDAYRLEATCNGRLSEPAVTGPPEEVRAPSPPDEPVVIVLPPRPVAMVYRIVTPQGDHLSAARVHAQLVEHDNVAGGRHRFYARAQLDDPGTYVITGLPPDREIHVQIQVGGVLVSEQARSPSSGTDEATAVVDVPAGRIRGRVLDESGQPVSAYVRAAASGRHANAVAPNGTFDLGFLSGPVTVVAWRPRRALGPTYEGPSPADRRRAWRGEGPAEIELTVAEADKAITGRVIDEDGNGVGLCRVSVGGNPFRPSRLRSSTATDESGAFTLAGLPPGKHDIVVEGPAGRRALKRGVSTSQPVKIILPLEESTVYGQVVLADGAIPDRFEVRAKPTAPADGYARSLFSGGDVSWELRGLVPGTYRVEIVSPGGDAERVVDVDGATDLGRIELSDPGSIRGTVVDDRGRSIFGARVVVVGQLHPTKAQPLMTRTGRDGTFMLTGVPAGPRQLRISDPGGAHRLTVPCTVEPYETLELGELARPGPS
ncbi:MAG: carboxypeptidase regulatory-like domain-containing protein [bacterium]|nr:carboxypeptidase regulatory-like domain-containing protein [bacterium]